MTKHRPTRRMERRRGGGGARALSVLLVAASLLHGAAAFLIRPPSSTILRTRVAVQHAAAPAVAESRQQQRQQPAGGPAAPHHPRLEALVREAVGLMTPDPADALRRGTWFKLICGASYQDLPRIKTLALAYTLAGADCIDMSASEAVVTAATEGVDRAMQLAAQLGSPLPRRPWLMVSVNDQEDLHFRKASFDASRCPADCPRPCEAICPTRAIPPPPAALLAEAGRPVEGVAEQGRCYGCGRCLSVCPLGLIEARPYEVDAAAVLASLAGRVDALEIHTNASSFSLSSSSSSSSPHSQRHDNDDDNDDDPFRQLCARLRGRPSDGLKLISVSFPFFGEPETAAFLRHRSRLLAGLGTSPGPGLRVWQTDGRPMSGDIGNGTTLSCVRFGEVVLRARALPFFGGGGGGQRQGQGQEGEGDRGGEQQQHFLQLAGGTNAYTAEKLRAGGLLSPLPSSPSRGQEEHAQGRAWVHGLAFGGFARKEVDSAMAARGLGLEDSVEGDPEALADVVAAALGVVRPIKTRR